MYLTEAVLRNWFSSEWTGETQHMGQIATKHSESNQPPPR